MKTDGALGIVVIAVGALLFLGKGKGEQANDYVFTVGGFPDTSSSSYPTPALVASSPSLRFDDWRSILFPYYLGLDLTEVTLTLGLPPLVAGGNKGITLGDNVYFDPVWWGSLSDGQKLAAMAHELVHVRQWKERGIGFLWDYLSQSFRPHDEITLELDAIAQEKFVARQLGVVYVSA